MGRRRRQDGTCRLCGAHGWLSYEHVPPKRAFNDHLVVLRTIADYLNDRSMEGRGKYFQGGFGAFTLCERCNNNTGGWYGKTYAAAAREGFELLGKLPERPARFPVTFRKIHPLRLVKQAATLFFSVHASGWRERVPELESFVLNPERRGLPNGLSIYLTLVTGHGRSSAHGGMLNVETGDSEVIAEVAHPPFSWLLVSGEPRRDSLGCVRHLATYGYHEQLDVRLVLTRGEIATPYPGDFRRRQDLPSQQG